MESPRLAYSRKFPKEIIDEMSTELRSMLGLGDMRVSRKMERSECSATHHQHRDQSLVWRGQERSPLEMLSLSLELTLELC